MVNAAAAAATLTMGLFDNDGDNDECIDRQDPIVGGSAPSTSTSTSTTAPANSNPNSKPDSYSDSSHGQGEHTQQHHHHPVDSDERIRRRLLNKHLKQRNKLRKHETRMQQAISRNDGSLEERARTDWEKYTSQLLRDPNSVLNYKPPPPPPPLPLPQTVQHEHEHENEINHDGDGCPQRSGSGGGSPKRFRFRSWCCQLHQGSRFRHLHPSMRSMAERDTQRVREGSAWLLEFRQKLVPRVLESHALRSSSNSNKDNNDDDDNDNDNGTTDKINTNTNTNTNTSSGSGSNGTKKSRSSSYWKSLRISKVQQTLHAAKLKANMQRGTQTESMFQDELALLGYTRQKFHERAVLAFSSLDRLDPCYGDIDNENGIDINIDNNDNNTDTEGGDREILRCIWERLMAIEQVVSIGCGPGCDAVGALGFLKSHEVDLVNGIVLMDFVVEAWKDLVLESLMPMVVGVAGVPSDRVRPVFCDVRESLLPSTATVTVTATGIGTETETNDGDDDDSENRGTNRAAATELTSFSASHRRLVVVSYLLTETRHKWKLFFGDLLRLLKGTQSLLLLTEPTAWQLHEFLRCFGSSDVNDNGNGNGNTTNSNGNRSENENHDNDNGNDDDLLVKAHVWLDSSRDLPHLQALDKRNGPAILLVCTK